MKPCFPLTFTPRRLFIPVLCEATLCDGGCRFVYLFPGLFLLPWYDGVEFWLVLLAFWRIFLTVSFSFALPIPPEGFPPPPSLCPPLPCPFRGPLFLFLGFAFCCCFLFSLIISSVELQKELKGSQIIRQKINSHLRTYPACSHQRESPLPSSTGNYTYYQPKCEPPTFTFGCQPCLSLNFSHTPNTTLQRDTPTTRRSYIVGHSVTSWSRLLYLLSLLVW